MNRSAWLFACATLVAGTAAWAQDRPGDFDFYLLSLSWSPTWCATDEDADRSRQCRGGHGFIVHGLWPQYEEGYPEFCAGERPPRISADLAEGMRDIMPDRQLVFQQWRKHGTCSGLSPAEYFAETRAAFDQVAIPSEFQAPRRNRAVSAQELERAFTEANDGLTPERIAVSCTDGWVAEVRICLTLDLEFRDCAEVDRRGCRQSELRLPAPG